ncbi:MAG: hypothetical protein HY267_03050 [Deltaproteobacteria bacterium]|nr:hypothetical protein [Deltaproteobacteria bacterium]
MGNFLILVSRAEQQDDAERFFIAGLEHFRQVKMASPNGLLRTSWVRAAAFARLNGSGTPLVTDPYTASGLLAVGSWFHRDGYSVGSEERLLKRYGEVGAEQLGRELEGFFTIVVIDASGKEVVVITDLIGSCHAFVRPLRNALAISSSSFILASLDTITLDPVASQEFLYTGNIYEDRTLYQEVRKLGPATVFHFAEGAVRSQQQYWRFADLTAESLDGDEAVEKLGETLSEAAQRIGQAFASPVCDLTGGYDSRALVAAFQTAGVRFATTVSGPEESADVRVSRQLAKLLGVTHLRHEAPAVISFATARRSFALTDGEYDLLEYSRIAYVHNSLSQQFDISLNGSFGEVARGYWWELLFPHAGERRPLNARQLAQLRFAAAKSETSLFPPELRLSLANHFTEVVERTNSGLSHFPNSFQMDHVYLTMRMQRWQGRIASSTNQIWPCLSPFLFRSVMETMLQTTVRLRRRSLLIRKMLLRLQPQLAEFPLEHGYPAVPATWKNLHRFSPLFRHYGGKVMTKAAGKITKRTTPQNASPTCQLRSHLWQEEEVQDLLNAATTRLDNLVDRSALAKFLRQSQHPSFAWHEQWARLLTMEYALRVGEQLRTGCTGAGLRSAAASVAIPNSEMRS